MPEPSEPGKEHWAAKRARIRREAQGALSEVLSDERATTAQRVAASRALLLDTRRKGKKKRRGEEEGGKLTGEDIAMMRVRLRSERGCELLAERRSDEALVEEFKGRCERSLYFFVKFCGVAPDLTAHLHKGVAEWLQDWPGIGAREERIKLLMMPTQHLKTSMASHGLPLHMVIQPRSSNIYFPGMLGRDVRIALIGESADKAEENLSVVTSQLTDNVWIRNLWPEVVWEDLGKAPKWSAKFASVPRTVIRGEPTFTALGVGTKLYQRHYDVIICDDLIGWDAAGSPEQMKDVNEWRKGLLTRRHSPLDSIMLFIGTHFTPSDIYVSMKKELPAAAVISRSVLEHGEPIWPERFPLTVVEQLKRQMGVKLFAHLMMNLPTAEGFTGFDWELVRLFEFEGEGLQGSIRFMEGAIDEEIRAIYADPMTQLISRWKRGEPLSSLYPGQTGGNFVDPYDEKNRTSVERMGFEGQSRLKQFAYLRGKYGEQGPLAGLLPMAEGPEVVHLRAPTSRVVREN